MTLHNNDFATIKLLQEEHDSLTARWKDARPYSQEVANLHASFQSWEKRVGRAIEAGLFQRILAAHESSVPAVPKRDVPPGKWKVDMPDGTYGRMPGDPPGPASVQAVIGGYVYDVEPRTGRLIACEPPTGYRLQKFNEEMQQRAAGVGGTDGR